VISSLNLEMHEIQSFDVIVDNGDNSLCDRIESYHNYLLAYKGIMIELILK
jgi:hypothetical protein